MISIITGDIIHSHQVDNPALWLDPLKRLLNEKGKSPEIWEIYRGDSFQLKVPPPDALKTAFQIKSVIKQVKELDVRIAIGIGEESYGSRQITESSGDAFVRSGRLLEWLKQHKVNMGVKTFDDDFDDEMNMMLKLALVVLNSWSVNSAEIAGIMLANPELPQKKIGRQLGIAQSSVSERIQRGSLQETDLNHSAGRR
jgi:hypothetical protein